MSNEKLIFELEGRGNLISMLQQSTGSVRKFDSQVKQSSRVLNNHNQITTEASKRYKFLRGAAQQLGFQVGDYAVQVANGTSKMQAFGQQGAQMLGVFGPIGALLGAGVAIFSAIAVAAEKSAGSIKKKKDAMEDLGNYMSEFESRTSGAVDALNKFSDNAKMSFGFSAQLSDAQERFAQDMASKSLRNLKSDLVLLADAGNFVNLTFKQMNMTGVQTIAEIERLDSTISNLFERMTKTTDTQEAIALENQIAKLSDQNIALQEMSENVQKLADKFNISKDAAFRMAATMQQLAAANTAIGQSRAMVKLAGEIFDATNALRDADQKTINLYESLLRGAENGERLARAMHAVAAGVMNINTAALNKLSELQGELRAYQLSEKFNLGKDEARVMMAASRAEKAAMEAGVDSAAELASIAAEAARIERETIKAENALKSYTETSKKSGADIKVVLTDAQKGYISIANTIQTSMTSGFMSIVDGTKKAKDAFKDMARTIINKLFEVLVVQRLVGSFGYGPNGEVQSSGIVGAIMGMGKKATGGPVTGGKPYLVGEKGPELVVPSRNASVIPNNQLSGGGVTVNQNITFGSGVSRAEIQQMLPKIVETTKAAVFDAQRRSVGGRGYA